MARVEPFCSLKLSLKFSGHSYIYGYRRRRCVHKLGGSIVVGHRTDLGTDGELRERANEDWLKEERELQIVRDR